MVADGVHNMKAYFRDEQTGYDIDKGWVYTKNANETLDSAVIKISHRLNKLDIQPFDNVRIGTDIYLCVDSYQETQISLDPITYNYEIHLFSEIKKIENIILPNISITPHKLSDPLTIKGFIQQVWSLYCPKYRNGNFKYSLPDTWPDKFNRVCPEKQWTTSTLRDVLNDLFMLCDCIPVMRNNQIEILDLTKKNNPITDYNFITRSRSSQDYASEIKMNLQNVMQESTVTTYETINFISDGSIVNDSNLFLETQFPILKINHLWVNLCSGLPLNGERGEKEPIWIRADLCNLKLRNDVIPYSLVKEKKAFDVLNIKKYAGFNSWVSVEEYSKYKNYNLYYTRGDNKVFGFSGSNKISALETMPIISIIFTLAELSGLIALGVGAINDMNFLTNIHYGLTSAQNMWFFPTFEIEYETTKEVVFSASKTELLRNERTIMDNQTNAWVNAEAQGNLEYQKANRIGNEVVMINQRTVNNPIDIFDFLGDEIVYRTEYQIFDNYIDVNAYATKDYILRDYFTGINSKIRTWVNAQEEAFIRHDLYKYYVEFDEENSYEDTLNDTTLKIGNVISALSSSVFEPAKYCLVQCDNHPASNQCFVMNLVKRVIGNSIILTWGFNDNYVGVKIPNYSKTETSQTTDEEGTIDKLDISDTGFIPLSAQSDYGWIAPPRMIVNHITSLGGIPLQPFAYCDDDGNFNTIYVGFFSALPNIKVESGSALTKDNYWQKVSSQLYDLTLSDAITNPMPIFKISKDVFKDNKEIITGSLQIEYISNSKNILVYDNFLKLNHLIAEEPTQGLSVYTAPNLSATPEIVLNGLVSVQNVNDYSAQITITGTIDKWAWIYSGNTPLIRINADEIRSFYINLLRKRDKEGL